MKVNKRKELEAIGADIRHVTKLLEGDLAEAGTLSTLKMYEMMGEGYKAAMTKAFDIHCPSSFNNAVTCKESPTWMKSMIKEITSLEKK